MPTAAQRTALAKTDRVARISPLRIFEQNPPIVLFAGIFAPAERS